MLIIMHEYSIGCIDREDLDAALTSQEKRSALLALLIIRASVKLENCEKPAASW